MPTAYYSTVFEQSADEVWAALRDFSGPGTWYASVVTRCLIEDGKAGDAVGGIRRIEAGERAFREQLVAMSDVDRSYTYNFVEVDLPVRNYEATMRVTPITEGDKAFVEWSTTFDCAEAEHEHWKSFFADEIFATGLADLRAYIANSDPPRSGRE
jgi:hypothetical protein